MNYIIVSFLEVEMNEKSIKNSQYMDLFSLTNLFNKIIIFENLHNSITNKILKP